MYVAAAACITGGAYALDNIRKILSGEPRTKGTPKQEGLISQIINSIRGDSRFSTLSPEIQANANAHVMKIDDGDHSSDKKSFTDNASGITSSGAPLPPNDNDDDKKLQDLKQNLQRLIKQRDAQKSIPGAKKDRTLPMQIIRARAQIDNHLKSISVRQGQSKYNDATLNAKQKPIDVLRDGFMDPGSILNRAKGWF